MVDWTKPGLTDLYQDFLTFLKQRDDDLATMFNGSTSTNIINNTIRWSDANARFEKWNGSTWSNLTSKYLINVDTLDGFSAGTVATAFKLLSLNADSKLPASITGGAMSVNGFPASSSPSAGILLALDSNSRLPASITGDAATVGGKYASSFVSASKINTEAGSYYIDTAGSGGSGQSIDVGGLIIENYGVIGGIQLRNNAVFTASFSYTKNGGAAIGGLLSASGGTAKITGLAGKDFISIIMGTNASGPVHKSDFIVVVGASTYAKGVYQGNAVVA